MDTLIKLAATLEVRAEALLEGIEWIAPGPQAPGSFAVRDSPINRHIAERREDKEFMERLTRQAEENRPVLDRLQESEEEESREKPNEKGR